MFWRGRRQSDNVEDVRGGGRKLVVAGGGCGTIIIALLILFLGGKPSDVMRVLPPVQGRLQMAPASPRAISSQDKKAGEFASVILADTEDVWREVFRAMGKAYRDQKMVLFTDITRSGCGAASSSTGPFYCPADE